MAAAAGGERVSPALAAVVDHWGPYEWGRFDCLHLAEAASIAVGRDPWLDGELERRAVRSERDARRAARRAGGNVAAYRDILESGPYRPHSGSHGDGDAVLVDWPVVVGSRTFPADRRPIIGIVADGVILVAGERGLAFAGIAPPLAHYWRAD